MKKDKKLRKWVDFHFPSDQAPTNTWKKLFYGDSCLFTKESPPNLHRARHIYAPLTKWSRDPRKGVLYKLYLANLVPRVSSALFTILMALDLDNTLSQVSYGTSQV